MMQMEMQPTMASGIGLPVFDARCAELVSVVELLDLPPLHSLASEVFISRFRQLLAAIEAFFAHEETLLNDIPVPPEIRRAHLADHDRLRQLLEGIHQDALRKKNQTAIEVYETIRFEIERHVISFSFDVGRYLPIRRH